MHRMSANQMRTAWLEFFAAREHTVVPDTEKYKGIITELAQHYKGKVKFWEIWNEADIQP